MINHLVYSRRKLFNHLDLCGLIRKKEKKKSKSEDTLVGNHPGSYVSNKEMNENKKKHILTVATYFLFFFYKKAFIQYKNAWLRK